MNLLVTTQALDKHESNLGFFVEWVREFAKECEHVTVLCLREGEYDLPQNVHVYSLGKERGGSRAGRWLKAWRYLIALRRSYDAVFVHMNPEYALLGGWLWKPGGKPAALWYAHKSVTMRLRLAMPFIQYVFTVSGESFRVPTPKLRVMGHGIDTELFSFAPHAPHEPLRLLTVGRISPSKHLVEMLGALDTLHARGVAFSFDIVGAPLIAAELAYEAELKARIQTKPYRNCVRLLGAMDHASLPALLRERDIMLNFSETGNMDKVGLEALAAGMPLVSCNPPFKPALESHRLFFEQAGDGAAAASAIQHAATVDPAPLAQWVRQHHSLQSLIPRIVAILKGN